MSLAERISETPLFRGLSSKQHKELAAIAVERTVAKGSVIFFEGDEGDGFYVVTSGQVSVYKLSPEGKEQILHVFGPGEVFGEAAVFTGGHFPAHASAKKEETRIARMFRIIRTHPIHLVYPCWRSRIRSTGSRTIYLLDRSGLEELARGG